MTLKKLGGDGDKITRDSLVKNYPSLNVGVNQLHLQLVAGRSPVAGDFHYVLRRSRNDLQGPVPKLGERCVTTQKTK